MADWSETTPVPGGTTDYSQVLGLLRDRDKDVARLFKDDPTNPLEGFIRMSRLTNNRYKFQERGSADWADKVLHLSAGGTGATTAAAARTALGLGALSLLDSIAIGLGDIPNLPASKITSGVLAAARIPFASNTEAENGVLETKAINPYQLRNYYAGTQGTTVPSGTIVMFGGAAAPDGWLMCDGTSYDTTAKATLFDAIGYQFGGTGTNFNVPDLEQKFPIGPGGSKSIGDTGGAENVTLALSQIPSHIHSGSTGSSSHSHSGNTGSAGSHDHNLNFRQGGNISSLRAGTGGRTSGSTVTDSITVASVGNHTHGINLSGGSHSHSVSIGSAGGGGPHNNMPPYLTINFIIKE